MSGRWQYCIIQSSEDFKSYLRDYISRPGRRCLVVGGAGFDPRSVIFPSLVSRHVSCPIQGIFYREERILDQPLLRVQADKNQARMAEFIPGSTFPIIAIFDGATAVGGRAVTATLSSIDCTEFTDIFVDISALSSGIFFSIVFYLIALCDRIGTDKINLHLLVAERPRLDYHIRSVPAETASLLHGFKGERSLDTSDSQALLWIPTLAPGHADSLKKIQQLIHRNPVPLDICPIIPFPAADPRLPDQLVFEVREQLPWKIDSRNFIYAAESDPLDSYRAISSLVSTRERIFAPYGGSLVVLSPLGNKMMSVGAMLAAIEKRLPVAMVESIGYDDTWEAAEEDACDESSLQHIWLCGEALPPLDYGAES